MAIFLVIKSRASSKGSKSASYAATSLVGCPFYLPLGREEIENE